MKVWVATRDMDVLDLLGTALRMRWPTSGQLIVPKTFEGDFADSRDSALAIVDTDMDQVIVTKLIRALRDFPDVPILVLMNSKNIQDTETRAMVNGADDCLVKPFEIIDLILHMETTGRVMPMSNNLCDGTKQPRKISRSPKA